MLSCLLGGCLYVEFYRLCKRFEFTKTYENAQEVKVSSLPHPVSIHS
ncbi:mCG148492 [Mus musculus]|nr:mCG148492 [Mus musculus]